MTSALGAPSSRPLRQTTTGQHLQNQKSKLPVFLFTVQDRFRQPFRARLEVQPQGALHGDAAIPEGIHREDLALLGFLEGPIGTDDGITVGLIHILALGSQGLPHLAVSAGSVDQLYLAP